jgi:GWxTD domain-containing protein
LNALKARSTKLAVVSDFVFFNGMTQETQSVGVRWHKGSAHSARKSNCIVSAITLLALLIGLGLFGCASSNQTGGNPYQCFYDYAISKSSRPSFDATLFWSPDSMVSTGNRLDVYVSVKKARLNFEKENDSSFRASYVCTIRLDKVGEHMGGQEDSVISKEIDRTLRQKNYPGSNDNSYDAFMQSFAVSDGEYRVSISISDDQGRWKNSKIYNIVIPNTSNMNTVMGDILLLARYDSLDAGRKITPFILSNAGLLSDTIHFFTVVSSKISCADSIFFYLFGLRNHVNYSVDMNFMAYLNQQTRYDPCSYGVDTVLIYRYSSVSQLNAGYTFIFGTIPKPPMGRYLLKIFVRPNAVSGSNSNDELGSQFLFHVYNQSFPEITDNLVEMVNSLHYIAAPNEIKKILLGRSDSLIKMNLLSFWKDHGGYDKMERYYRRVGEANRFFTNDCVEGWKTPMGMFFVVCGPPDNVECTGAWDEKWSYIQPSTQNYMTINFRLANNAQNIDDRFYGIENIYSTADLWDYYVNQWRY